MNNETDKYLDGLTKKVIKGGSIETPSVDFTSSVMYQISELKTSTIAYKPLISKKGWSLVLFIILSLVVFIGFMDDSINSLSFGTLDFSILYENKLFETLSSFTMSKTSFYAVVFFGLMFGIQIPFMKSYFNKQYQ
jgi:hypothetical protein